MSDPYHFGERFEHVGEDYLDNGNAHLAKIRRDPIAYRRSEARDYLAASGWPDELVAVGRHEHARLRMSRLREAFRAARQRGDTGASCFFRAALRQAERDLIR